MLVKKLFFVFIHHHLSEFPMHLYLPYIFRYLTYKHFPVIFYIFLMLKLAL